MNEDREPQPSDGPEYAADHAWWLARHPETWMSGPVERTRALVLMERGLEEMRARVKADDEGRFDHVLASIEWVKWRRGDIVEDDTGNLFNRAGDGKWYGLPSNQPSSRGVHEDDELCEPLVLVFRKRPPQCWDDLR